MLPEANESGMLYCYRAVKFPDQWERLEPIRKEVRYVDTSVFCWKDKKMALTYQILDNENYKLVLLDIDEPKNDKEINVSDIAFRRPGGRMDSEKRVRVAQNCLNGYGEGLVFYRYNLADDGEYTEREIARISPEQLNYSRKMYLCGLHTYNSNEKYEVIDIKTRRFNVSVFCIRAKNRLKRMIKRGEQQ